MKYDAWTYQQGDSSVCLQFIFIFYKKLSSKINHKYNFRICRECSVNAGQKRRICRVVKVSYFLKILHVGFL